MKSLLIPLLCAVTLCLAGSVVYAGSSNLVFKDGTTVTVLEDNDWESLIGSTDPFLDPGEYLVGMLEVQDIFDAGNPANLIDNSSETFVAVFVAEVDTVDLTGPFPMYTFKPAGAAVWPTLLDNNGVNLGLPTPNSDDTFVMTFVDPDDPLFVNEGDGTGTMAAALATATNGTPSWEFGFRGEAGEQWTAKSGTTNILNPVFINAFISLNVTWYNPGDPFLKKHTFLWDGVVDPINPDGLNLLSELHGYGQLQSIPNGNFQLATDTDFYLVATPEPASLALLGLGLAAVGGVVVRRRRRS